MTGIETKSSAAALHAARRARGWTLQALGDRIGVTREAVRLWESGTVPSPRYREALHALLGVSWDVSRQETRGRGGAPSRPHAARRGDSAMRRARIAAGLTLEALGALAGCTIGHISKIERGLRLPTHALAGRLLDALDIQELACLPPGPRRRGMDAGPSRATGAGPYLDQGAQLRAARQRLRLTQRDVARNLGVSAVSVCHWELGTTRPCRANATQLAQLLDIDIDETCEVGRPGRPRTPEQPWWPQLKRNTQA